MAVYVAGSVTLKGNQANYGKLVKTGQWHQAIQEEPRDYVLATDPERDLRRSTYKYLGGYTDRTLAQDTTYGALCADRLKIGDQSELGSHPTMVNTSNLLRECDASRELPNARLPRHEATDSKISKETTYRNDYIPQMEMKSPPPDDGSAAAREALLSAGHKRCVSQFTDWNGARRIGRNTWADESGVYHNTHIRRALEVPSDPVLHQACCALPVPKTTTPTAQY
jgi:hypothetical protein